MLKRRHKTAAILAAVSVVLAGCASIVEGTDQTIDLQVSPESAVCKVSQKGSVIATTDKGGGQIRVPKSRDDLALDCTAAGYERQTMSIESSASGWGVVGCFLIDLCITDYSTGALNKYPKTISIRLQQQANMTPDTPYAASAAAPPFAGSAEPPPAGSAAQPPIWYTVGENVRAQTKSGWVIMPSSVPLVLVDQRDDQGLFQYRNRAGGHAEAWISMQNVRQELHK